MSGSGSSSQFGQWTQQSLVPNFDQSAHAASDTGTGPAAEHEVSISMPHIGARRVTHSGHIVNGFAPGATLYGGTSRSYEKHRREAEEGLFGVPRDAPHEERPIYGHLRHTAGDDPSVYGDVTFDLHTGDRRITTTPGDSMNNFTTFRRSDDSSYSSEDVEELNTGHRHENRNPDEEYREIQVHGGPIPIKQVKRATVFRDTLGDPDGTSSRETALELRRQKIPTRIMRHTEYQPTLDRGIFGKGEEGWVNAEAYQPIRRRGLT